MNTIKKLERLGFAGRAAQAAALVIDEKISQRRAAQQADVDPAAVSRLLQKITKTRKCRCCGHVVKEIKL